MKFFQKSSAAITEEPWHVTRTRELSTDITRIQEAIHANDAKIAEFRRSHMVFINGEAAINAHSITDRPKLENDFRRLVIERDTILGQWHQTLKEWAELKLQFPASA